MPYVVLQVVLPVLAIRWAFVNQSFALVPSTIGHSLLPKLQRLYCQMAKPNEVEGTRRQALQV